MTVWTPKRDFEYVATLKSEFSEMTVDQQEQLDAGAIRNDKPFPVTLDTLVPSIQNLSTNINSLIFDNDKDIVNFMLPKRRFWKSEPTFPNAFSKHFSTIRRPNRVFTPLKSASKTHSERLVRTSKIFVWEG